MKVYRVGIGRNEDQGDGENNDEYFGSLSNAKHRRAELIREDPGLLGCVYAEDYEIECIELADLPTFKLALAILNRQGWVGKCVELVPPYRPSDKVRQRAAEEARRAEEELLD